jgi:hypothetical protein
MHDGSLATIEQVIDYYDRGGNPNPALDPELRPLRLSAAEKQDLIAFLSSLNGQKTMKIAPAFSASCADVPSEIGRLHEAHRGPRGILGFS